MGYPEVQNKASDNMSLSLCAAPSDFKSKAIFDGISEAMAQDNGDMAKKFKGIYCFKVKGPGGQMANWIVDAKNGPGKVEYDGKTKADVTLTMADDDLVQLMTGKLNPQKAFFQGKLKIQGNMGLAMKLQELQKMAGPIMLKAKL